MDSKLHKIILNSYCAIFTLQPAQTIWYADIYDNALDIGNEVVL